MHLLDLPDAALVVGHKCHSAYGKVLQVCYAPDPDAAGKKQVDDLSPGATTAGPWLLLISQIPESVSGKFLVQFIENRLGLEQEKDFTLDYQPPCAQLAFSSERGNMR